MVWKSKLLYRKHFYILIFVVFLFIIYIFSKNTVISDTKAETLITTPEEFYNIRNNLSGSYVLGVDIDLGGYSIWEPIGNSSNKFTGSLDGKGFTIRNVTKTDSTSKSEIGLFGYTSGATIQNLNVENANFQGYHHVGTLIGRSDSTNVFHCYTSGTITGYGNSNGGIIGRADHTTISESASSVSLNTQGVDVGGITGYNYGGKVINCYCEGNVTGHSSDNGGLVGENLQGGTVSNCYSEGKVTGSSNNGGLVGNNSNGTINNSYYNKDTSGQSDIGKGNPLSTDQIKETSNFNNWDFDSIWIMTNDKPVLRYFYDGPTSISYECISEIKPENMNIGETFSIQVKIEPLDIINKQFHWQIIQGSDLISISKYDDSILKVTAKNWGKAIFYLVSDENENIKTENINVYICPVLDSFSIEGADLIPNFSSNIFDYKIDSNQDFIDTKILVKTRDPTLVNMNFQGQALTSEKEFPISFTPGMENTNLSVDVELRDNPYCKTTYNISVLRPNILSVTVPLETFFQFPINMPSEKGEINIISPMYKIYNKSKYLDLKVTVVNISKITFLGNQIYFVENDENPRLGRIKVDFVPSDNEWLDQSGSLIKDGMRFTMLEGNLDKNIGFLNALSKKNNTFATFRYYSSPKLISLFDVGKIFTSKFTMSVKFEASSIS